MKNKLIEFYLDYVNNFLTLERFAEYYGINIVDTEILYNLGKKYFNEN